MSTNLQPSQIVKASWEYFAKNINKLWVMAALLALPGVLSALLSDKPDKLESYDGFGSFSEFSQSVFGVSAATFGLLALVFMIVAIVYSGLVYGGSVKQMLSALKGENTQFGASDIFSAGRAYLANLIMLGLVVGLLIFAGLVLLIVPGLIAAFLLSLSLHFMVDKNLGVGGAMSSSYRKIKDHISPALLTYLWLIVINFGASIVLSVFLSADARVVQALAAAANGVFSVFGLVVVTKLYLALNSASPAQNPPSNP